LGAGKIPCAFGAIDERRSGWREFLEYKILFSWKQELIKKGKQH
jgi:hypothetical protein